MHATEPSCLHCANPRGRHRSENSLAQSYELRRWCAHNCRARQHFAGWGTAAVEVSAERLTARMNRASSSVTYRGPGGPGGVPSGTSVVKRGVSPVQLSGPIMGDVLHRTVVRSQITSSCSHPPKAHGPWKRQGVPASGSRSQLHPSRAHPTCKTPPENPIGLLRRRSFHHFRQILRQPQFASASASACLRLSLPLSRPQLVSASACLRAWERAKIFSS